MTEYEQLAGRFTRSGTGRRTNCFPASPRRGLHSRLYFWRSTEYHSREQQVCKNSTRVFPLLTDGFNLLLFRCNNSNVTGCMHSVKCRAMRRYFAYFMHRDKIIDVWRGMTFTMFTWHVFTEALQQILKTKKKNNNKKKSGHPSSWTTLFTIKP